MNPREAIITRIYETKFGEVVIAHKFKKGEFTDQEIRDFRDRWSDGIPQQVEMSDYQVESDHIILPEKPKEKSFFVKFKEKCIEYSGPEYYSDLKKHLKIHHLRDLENKYGVVPTRNLLDIQALFIYYRMHGNDPELACDYLAKTYSGEEIKLWKQYLDSFNNPK